MPNILFKIARIFNSQFKCNYLKNEKLFVNFLIHFLNQYKILGILKGKMIVIANVFPKLQTVKNFVGTFSKKHRFSQHFDSEHMKASQILAISPWQRFYHVFSSFSLNLIRKMSPLAFGDIIGAIVNTLTTDGKYFAWHCENVPLPIQIQLSEK